MQQLLESPLVAASRHLDQAAIFDGARTWTWRQVHEAAMELAPRLRGASTVCNLCTSRLGFLVTSLAALRISLLVVLPSSGSSADLSAVSSAKVGGVVVIDAEPASDASSDSILDARAVVRFRPDWKPAQRCAGELAWQPAWEEVAFLLHTSGSTGDPHPQPKTLLHLARGALLLAARLETCTEGGIGGVDRIVCSVPPQHMFGLECSVMLPLVFGTPVLDRRPLLPADVHAAFEQGPRGVWIATPMHLSGLARSAGPMPSCAFAIVSTMPLGHALARQSEHLLRAPVLEVYGSTETGALAMRRTAHETRWLPLEGVQLERVEGDTLARGAHFESPVTLLDELVVEPGGTFALLGRQADLIKIAGRRASLAGLNLLLQDLPGFEDGVFYMPATGDPAERLCLIYAGAPLDRAATRRWLRTRLDPAFLPREFIRLDRLPRNENGKLRRHSLDVAYARWQAAAQRQRKLPATASHDPATVA
jgi:acyl-coenzyme A synthetase/AMP-(fatty) acid ligase